MLVSHGSQRSHVCGLSKQMNCQDSAGFAGNNGFFHARRVQQQRSSVNIDERHAKSTVERGRGTGDEGKIWHDNLTAVIEAVVIERSGQTDA